MLDVTRGEAYGRLKIQPSYFQSPKNGEGLSGNNYGDGLSGNDHLRRMEYMKGVISNGCDFYKNILFFFLSACVVVGKCPMILGGTWEGGGGHSYYT